MARLWTEGFEMQDLVGWTSPAYFTINTTTKRSGAASGLSSGGATSSIYKSNTGISEGYFRFAMYVSSISNDAIQWYWAWRNDTTILGGIRFTNTRKLAFFTGSSTLVATSTTVLELNTWYLIEVRIKIADSGTLTCKIDGVVETAMNYSGDTKPDANTTFDNLYHSRTASVSVVVYFDDMALNDTSGGVDDSWCGDGRIIALHPDSTFSHQLTGSDADTTDNHLMVDEIPTDSDTTYVYGTVVDEDDLYAISPCGLDDTVTINRIWAEARCRDAVAAGGEVALITVASGGAEVSGGDVALLTTYTIRVLGAEQRVNPVDSAAWEPADVDAVLIGPRTRN